MSINWKPSGNKILVKMDTVEKTTKSGIILGTETLNERAEMAQMEGVVVAKGPLAYHDQAVEWVHVGDRVKISKFSGYLHEEDGIKYRVIHDLDVIMVRQGE